MTSRVNQTFSFKDLEAHSVLLAGDFTHWLKDPIPLQKQRDGVWTATASLTPGTHYYRFLVDGEWHDDPECKIRVQNAVGAIIVVPNPPAQKEKPAGPAPESARAWGM
jgi:1,4-alpha-glucan branching enzyme